MEFDELKQFNGKVCSGIFGEGTHAREYPRGMWRERAVAPDQDTRETIMRVSSTRSPTSGRTGGRGTGTGDPDPDG